MVWAEPDSLFVSRDYPGKKSQPEWGLNLAKKYLPLLKEYEFSKMIGAL